MKKYIKLFVDNVLIGPGVIIYSQNHLSYSDSKKLIINQGYEKAVTFGQSFLSDKYRIRLIFAIDFFLILGVIIGEGL